MADELPKPQQVVVVGGGFGGLEVCRRLSRLAKSGEIELTLLDRENFFQFNPLLPEVATGAIETRHIVYPLREFCAPRQIRFVRNTLKSIDTAKHTLQLHNDITLPYDLLVLALGSSTHYFGIPGAEEHAFPFKTLMDAIRLRAHAVEMFELADQATDPLVQRALLTFVVAGGGITGVEVCASLMDLFRRTMRRLYPRVPQSLISVYLIEAGPRLLPGIREKHAELAAQHLRSRGVNLLLNRKVSSVSSKDVALDDGAIIPANTVIWTTGVRGQTLDAPWTWELGRSGRLRVGSNCRVAQNIWAIGDLVDCTDADGESVPMVAQGAVQAGKVVAQQIQNQIVGTSSAHEPTLNYQNLGYFVGLGRSSTVASVLGVPLHGPLAWYLWALAYLLKMVGLRKQLEVAFDILKGLFVDHDTSQIHERKRMLRPSDFDRPL